MRRLLWSVWPTVYVVCGMSVMTLLGTESILGRIKTKTNDVLKIV